MTLVITAVHRDVGIWQSSDHAIVGPDGTRHADDWCKQVVIICADGALLLAYSGLARGPDRSSVAGHLALAAAPFGPSKEVNGQIQVRVGHVTVEETIDRIVDKMSLILEDWGTRYRSYYGQILRVSGACIVDGVHRLVMITNDDEDPAKPRQMARLGIDDPVMGTTMVFGDGSGSELFTTGGYQRAMIDVVSHHPADPCDSLNILGGVNQAVAVARGKVGVTRWCQTVFLPNSLMPIYGRMFMPPQALSIAQMDPARVVYHGGLAPSKPATAYRGRPSVLRNMAAMDWMLEELPDGFDILADQSSR